MTRKRVISPVGGLVGLACAGKIHGDDATPGFQQAGDHLAIEIGPGRVAMQQEDGLSITRALVDVVDAELSSILILDGLVVGRPRITRQVCKTFVWRT